MSLSTLAVGLLPEWQFRRVLDPANQPLVAT